MVTVYNRGRIDIRQSLVTLSEMMFGPTKGGKSSNVMMHSIICADQKSESFVYCLLCPLATYDILCFTALVDVFSSILSIRGQNKK